MSKTNMKPVPAAKLGPALHGCDVPEAMNGVANWIAAAYAFIADPAARSDEGERLEAELRALYQALHTEKWKNLNYIRMVHDHLGIPNCTNFLDSLVFSHAYRLDCIQENLDKAAVALRAKVHGLAAANRPRLASEAKNAADKGEPGRCLELAEKILSASPGQNDALEVLDTLERCGGELPRKLSKLRNAYCLRPDALPAITAPLPVFGMAYDGRDRLYQTCFETDGWTGCLTVCRLGETKARPFTGLDTAYSGIWFDRENRLLYALSTKKAKQPFQAINVFEADGAYVKRLNLTDEFGWLQSPMILQGDGRNLYVLDWGCFFIVKISLTEPGKFDIIDFKGLTNYSSFQVHGSRLITTHRHINGLSVYDLKTEKIAYATGYDTLFCTLATGSADGRRLLAICGEGEPDGYKPSRHWLSAYDAALKPVYRHCLGPGRPLDMLILDERNLLAVSDHSGEISFFGLKPEARRPKTKTGRK